jgi:predicted nucleic acid-binding Zn ribbon protein
MATYLYETIPERDGDTPRRFEVVQSMKDAPLTRDPETGLRVRRVISGGYGLMRVGSEKSSPVASAAAPCGPGCACHAGPRIPTP